MYKLFDNQIRLKDYGSQFISVHLYNVHILYYTIINFSSDRCEYY